MAHLPKPQKVSYCKYGYPYQKHTAIWTNTDIKFLVCKNDCNSLDPAASVDSSGRIRLRHLNRAQRGSYKANPLSAGNSLSQLHSIPPLLCRHICHYVMNQYNKDNGENREPIRGAELPRSRAPEESSEEQGDPIHKGANG